MLGTTVAPPLAGPGAKQPALRGDHEVVGIGMERLGDQALRDVRAVRISGVDEVDTEDYGAPQQRPGRVRIGRLAPDAPAGQPHRPESHAANLELAAQRQALLRRGSAVGAPAHSIPDYPRASLARLQHTPLQGEAT